MHLGCSAEGNTHERNVKAGACFRVPRVVAQSISVHKMRGRVDWRAAWQIKVQLSKWMWGVGEGWIDVWRREVLQGLAITVTLDGTWWRAWPEAGSGHINCGTTRIYTVGTDFVTYPRKGLTSLSSDLRLVISSFSARLHSLTVLSDLSLNFHTHACVCSQLSSFLP